MVNPADGRLPRPYYDEGGVTLYHGDARELTPALEYDVTLTDPPWPMKADVMQGSRNAEQLWLEVGRVLEGCRLLVWLPVHVDPRDYLHPLFEWLYLRQVYLRRAIPGYFGRVLMDGEVVHVLGEWPTHREGRHVIPGGLSFTYVPTDRVMWHPGPRSLVAAQWLLSWWTDPGDVVFDPFAGSGTTLLAAKNLGRKAVGVEIEERYCEGIAERLSQAVMPLDVGAPMLPEQALMEVG